MCLRNRCFFLLHLLSWFGFDYCDRLEALHEAGLPPGVVQFVPGVAEECGRVLTQSPDLAALHFTGSTATFNHLWRSISTNISKYSCPCLHAIGRLCHKYCRL